MEKQLRTDFKKIVDSSNFSEKEIITKVALSKGTIHSLLYQNR